MRFLIVPGDSPRACQSSTSALTCRPPSERGRMPRNPSASRRALIVRRPARRCRMRASDPDGLRRTKSQRSRYSRSPSRPRFPAARAPFAPEPFARPRPPPPRLPRARLLLPAIALLPLQPIPNADGGRPVAGARRLPVCFAQRYGFRRSHVRRATRHEGRRRHPPAELRASPKQTNGTASPRPPGTVLSVPSTCAAITRARLLTRPHPRCASPSETPGSPVTSKAPSLERFPSTSIDPPARGTCPCPPTAPERFPRTRHASHAVPSGFQRASDRRETRRGAVPMLLAPQRRSPVARLSPGFIRRRRRTRRVRRLDSHRVLQGRSRSPNDVRSARCVVTHRPLRRRASSPSHTEDGTPVAPLLVVEYRDATTRRGAPSRADNAPDRPRTSHHARRRGPCH